MSHVDSWLLSISAASLRLHSLSLLLSLWLAFDFDHHF